MSKVSPLLFINNIAKPYRKWYIFLCLAPIFSGVSFTLSNYAIKTIIDTIIGEIDSYGVFIYPFCIFIGIEILTRFFWSLHDYSEYKIHGNVFRDVIVKPYEYLQNHSYAYFQNNFSGSLVSKIKGISDGYYMFWDNISHRLLENLSLIVCNIIMMGLLSKYLILPVIFGMLIFGSLGYIQSIKYDKYSFEVKSNYHKLLGMISDKIANIFTVFAFCKKEKELNNIKDFYKNIQTPALDKINYYNFITWVIFGIIYSITFLGIFMYAIYLRKVGIISTGALSIAILMLIRSCHEIFALSNNALSLIQNLADFRASLDGIYVKQQTLDKKDARRLNI
jgi:ATP-binding cassette subfamily B protein